MTAILIGAGVAGVVLGATSRLVFLLPAALMALMVAAVLIVRADVDLRFTALAATLLNGGFLLGVVMAQVLPRLSVSPPWRVDQIDAGFIVRDHGGQPLARVGSTADRSLTACSPATKRGRLNCGLAVFIDAARFGLSAMLGAKVSNLHSRMRAPFNSARCRSDYRASGWPGIKS